MLSESTKIKYAAAFFRQRLFTIQSRLRHTRLHRAHVGQFTLCMIYDEASVSSSALAYSVYADMYSKMNFYQNFKKLHRWRFEKSSYF